MKLIVHRGAHEIGGNCVEVSQNDSTIILDIGLPLTFSFPNPSLTILSRAKN